MKEELNLPTLLIKIKKLEERLDEQYDKITNLENKIDSMELEALYKEHPELY